MDESFEIKYQDLKLYLLFSSVKQYTTRFVPYVSLSGAGIFHKFHIPYIGSRISIEHTSYDNCIFSKEAIYTGHARAKRRVYAWKCTIGSKMGPLRAS